MEISPCRLLPPPCYASRDEGAAQSSYLVGLDRWRATCLRTHDQFLFLVPESDPPLQERLDLFLKVMRAAYERDKNHWEKEIARLTTSRLEDLQLGSEEARQQKLVTARRQLGYVMAETRPTNSDGSPDVSAGWLKWTLEDIKRGALGIRDLWLHEQWAQGSGEDLEAMARERHLFRDWLEARTGTPASIFDATTRQTRQGVNPPHFGERFENNPQFLEACARVNYRARFADNAGTVVYLADFEEREELDAAELEEVAKLRPGPSSGEIEAKAAHQRTLSSGLMLTVGSLVEKMTGDEKLLFNFLLT